MKKYVNLKMNQLNQSQGKTSDENNNNSNKNLIVSQNIIKKPEVRLKLNLIKGKNL